ncbi:MAG: VanZ family protein [Alphaproteobacteria bacterium]
MRGYRWARVGFWCGVGIITVTSVLPKDALPPVELWDKLLHVLSYAAVAALGGAGFGETRTRQFIALGLITLGALLEVAQIYVPGRFGEFGDVVANTSGVVAGNAVICLIMRMLRGHTA